MARLRIDVKDGHLLLIQAEAGQEMLLIVEGGTRFASYEIDPHSLESVAEFFSEDSILTDFNVKGESGDGIALEREAHDVGACGIRYQAPNVGNVISITDADGSLGKVFLNAKDSVRVRDFLGTLNIKTE